MSAVHAQSSARPRLTREDVLDGREVAALLDLPVSTVLEYARRGVLPGHKLGRRWIFLRDEVEATVRGACARG
jgi:excisionase family DNA binding protein